MPRIGTSASAEPSPDRSAALACTNSSQNTGSTVPCPPPETPPRQDVEALIALSDERDAQLELRHHAYREGYRDGARDQFSAGYAAAIADVKRTWHEIAAAVGLACRRLTPGGDVWLDSVIRNRATEYGGAGKPRVPADPAAIVLAWKSRQHKGGSK